MYSRDNDWGLNDLEKIRSKHQNKKVTKKKTLLAHKRRSVTSQFCEIPEIFSFSQALEISKQYLLLGTVILQKKLQGVPDK